MISAPPILETAAQWGSIATAIAAVVGVFMAWHQIKESRLSAKESTATNLFHQSLTLSLQYPRFGDPADLENFNREDLSQYEWFVSAMLLSCEEILLVTDGNVEWRNSVKGNLSVHSAYLAVRYNSDYKFKDYYSGDIVDIVKEISDDFKGSTNA